MNIVPNLKCASFRKEKLFFSAVFSIILEYIDTILKNITVAFLQWNAGSFSFTWAIFVTGS